MSDETVRTDGEKPATTHGKGCAMTLACINVAAMGLLASTFTTGPFSSVEQELWYRYGSLAFLLLGAVLPGAALLLGTRRHPAVIAATMVWMIAMWLPFAGYVLMSGGGI
jgi:hypothetical protein